jgi:hypothetical protein
MDNQSDTKTLADVDFSGIEGYESPTDNSAIESPVEAIEAPVEAIEAPEETVETVNGPISWAEMEGIVPEPLHEDIKPLVEDWRRQYERILEESTPFKRFAEQGYSDKDLDMAVQVQQALIKDPRRFYDGLAETYGWNREAQLAQQLYDQQQQSQTRQAPPQDESMFVDDWGNTVQQAPADNQLAQQLQETQKRLEQMEQYQQTTMQEQQQQQQAAAGRAQLEQELTQLESKYGQFDRQEVVKRAVGNASAGQNPSVAQAFHELRDYEENLRRKFASNRPPKVMGSGNGMTPAPKIDLSSDDAKREAALALAIRLGADN